MSSQFQPYLESICVAYEKWQRSYTPTDAEGKQRQSKEASPFFEFGLTVQTVTKDDREQQKEEKIERFPVLEGIRKYADQHVLLVGRPGSGKSTALARLMLEEATSQARIPVFVELRYWQSSIEQLIFSSLTRHELSAEQYEAVLSRSLLLFDGVNELPSEEARLQLSAFRRDHPKLPMIFTTRDLSVGGDLGIEKKLEMQPLKPEQMEAFIRSYLSPEQAEEMLRQLNDRLREFGQTPLLLWMLCEVFQQCPDNQLPSNLGEVFQAFTAMYETSSVREYEVALLKGDVRPLSDRRLWKKALKSLALLMMQGERPVDFRVVIHRDEAERELSRIFPNEPFPVRDILDDLLKYHLLQNRSVDQIEFRHQLIQEYYAAEALLARLPLSGEVLKREYLNYLKWTESIALMLSLIEEAQALQVVESAIDVDLMLGARLAGEVKFSAQKVTVSRVIKLEVPQSLKLQLLGATRSSVAVPYLIETLQTRENMYRQMDSAFALRTLGNQAAVSDLICTLASENEITVAVAVFALGALGDHLAIPALVEALNHPHRDVRSRAANSLGELHAKQAVPQLIEKLNDDHYVREEAVDALGEIGDENAIPALIRFVLSDSNLLCWKASKALKQINHKKATEELLKVLEDENYEVRDKAAESLGEIGSESAVETLLRVLENGNANWRIAEALKKIGGKSVILGLVKSLEHRDSSVCECAAYVLGELGDNVAVTGLIGVLNHWDWSVSEKAIEALGKLGDTTAIPHLMQFLQAGKYRLRQAEIYQSAIIALGRLGSPDAKLDLLKMLEQQSLSFHPSVWSQIFNALEKLGGEDVVTALLNALKFSNCHIRMWAAEVLGNLGNEKAITGLLEVLKDENASVRHKAGEAIGKLGGQTAISGLFNLLENSADNEAREATIRALGKLSHEGEIVVPKLLELLEKEPDIRYHVIEALKEIGSPIALNKLQEVQRFLDDNFTYAITTIQNCCKYYNYDVFQAHLKAQKNDRQLSQPNDRPTTQNFYGNVYGVAGTVEGNLIVSPPKSVD